MSFVKRILTILCLFQINYVNAATGSLFNVTTSGATLAAPVSFTLCLNVRGSHPLSCQNFTTSRATLAIQTTIPNHTYQYAGIKVNTPGFDFTGGTNSQSSGYSFIGTVSNTQAVNGTIEEDTAAPVLALSVSNMALSITGLTLNGENSGIPRIITVSNTSAVAATGLTIDYPTWPTGTTAASDCGATLAAGSRCHITIAPGASSTSGCSDTGTAPTPGVITVSADGATPVTSNVVVLDYGCIYEGGYIFSMTETADAFESITGKVVATENQAPASPLGVVWTSNGGGSTGGFVSFDIIPGVGDASTTMASSPSYGLASGGYNATYTGASVTEFPFPGSSNFAACEGKMDGACNTANILALYDATYSGKSYIITNYGVGCDGTTGCTLQAGPTNSSYYAAGLCSGTINDKENWYLPALCEMGPNAGAPFCPPTTQNIMINLTHLIGSTAAPTTCFYSTFGSTCIYGRYWSSTENSTFPKQQAYSQFFDTSGNSQSSVIKSQQNGVRCVRAF